MYCRKCGKAIPQDSEFCMHCSTKVEVVEEPTPVPAAPEEHAIDDDSEMIWNGRNEYGDKIANGVYFCRLSLNSEYYWTKLAVVN